MFKPDGAGCGMREELTASAKEAAELYNLLFGQDDDLDYEAEFYEDECPVPVIRSPGTWETTR
jgi:hypothetical protein